MAELAAGISLGLAATGAALAALANASEHSSQEPISLKTADAHSPDTQLEHVATTVEASTTESSSTPIVDSVKPAETPAKESMPKLTTEIAPASSTESDTETADNHNAVSVVEGPEVINVTAPGTNVADTETTLQLAEEPAVQAALDVLDHSHTEPSTVANAEIEATHAVSSVDVPPGSEDCKSDVAGEFVAETAAELAKLGTTSLEDASFAAVIAEDDVKVTSAPVPMSAAGPDSTLDAVAEVIAPPSSLSPVAEVSRAVDTTGSSALNVEALATGATLTAVGGAAAGFTLHSGATDAKTSADADDKTAPAPRSIPETPTTAVPDANQGHLAPNDPSESQKRKPQPLALQKDGLNIAMHEKSDSELQPVQSERDITATHAMSSDTLSAIDPNPATPSYVMHYPESLFGDSASITPGLITIEDLHAAQKASPVVGVSTVNATSSGRKSRDSGFYQSTDGDASVGQRMRRLMSGRRADTGGRAATGLEAREGRAKSPTRLFTDAREKLVSQYRSTRNSQEYKRGSGAPSATTIGADEEEDEDSKYHAMIPGSYPSAAQQKEGGGDGDVAAEQKQPAYDNSAGSSDNEATKDHHRRHTIMGVFKRIFR
ncbi:hypothetical protein H4R24_002552 [Coemansia sp. RSA 988]|nr:hypothetical protein H4R24_002552 [Coemansia sp. RSA 988]